MIGSDQSRSKSEWTWITEQDGCLTACVDSRTVIELKSYTAIMIDISCLSALPKYVLNLLVISSGPSSSAGPALIHAMQASYSRIKITKAKAKCRNMQGKVPTIFKFVDYTYNSASATNTDQIKEFYPFTTYSSLLCTDTTAAPVGIRTPSQSVHRQETADTDITMILASLGITI